MSHTCHWTGCTKQVPPKLWGCSGHWFSLPTFLRSAIWRHYQAGQEISKTPSREYVTVARLVQLWIEARTVRINDVPGGRGLTPAEVLKINIAFCDQLKAANL